MKNELDQKLDRYNRSVNDAYVVLDELYALLKAPFMAKKINALISEWGIEDPTGEDRNWTDRALDALEEVERKRKELFTK